MFRIGFRRRLSVCGLLLAGMLVSGCGKEAEENLSVGENQTEEESRATDAEGDGVSSGKNDEISEEEELYSRYRSISMDMGVLGMENQLLDMKCLATENGAYAAGARLNQGAVETAVYRLQPDQAPELVLSIPEERMLTWCRTEEGIAVLGEWAEVTEEEVKLQYSLHLYQGEALEEKGEWSLTEVFAEKGIESPSFGPMALEGEELVLSEKVGEDLYIVDLSTEEVLRTITVENGVEALQYEDSETVLGISVTGTLYAIHPRTGGVETRSEQMFAQVGAMQHWMIGENRIMGGSARGLYAVSSDGTEKKLADYEYGLEPESSLWLDEDGSQGVMVSWKQDSRKVAIYYLSERDDAHGEDDREVITMSGFGVCEEYRKAVVEFNQNNEQYRIEILEEAESSIEDLVVRMETQLMNGQGADLLLVNTWTWFRDYVANGYLEDLMPYIQRDLDPEDYVQPALYAYEKDGGVYAVENSFGLAFLVADRKLTKGAKTWTLQDMYRLAGESDIPFLGKNWDRQTVLSVCMNLLGSGIFDMEQVRECILFAEKYGTDSAGITDADDWKLGEDYMLEEMSILTPLGLADCEQYYGEDAVIMGYPGAAGERIENTNWAAASINRASGHKEGAWAFIRFCLGREYQFSMDETEGFPLWKEAFEARLAKYQAPPSYDIYLPEAGGIITVENTHYLPRSMSQITAMTEEQIGRLRDLVDESGVSVWYAETEASGIVGEEAESYFQGSKDIDQVVEVIRGRLEMLQGERE